MVRRMPKVQLTGSRLIMSFAVVSLYVTTCLSTGPTCSRSTDSPGPPMPMLASNHLVALLLSMRFSASWSRLVFWPPGFSALTMGTSSPASS